jgi:hypothetical protein
MCKEYNGWPNWETWNANLWIDNVDGVQDHIQYQANAIVADADDDGHAKYEIAKMIEQSFEELFIYTDPENQLEGPMADAINSYLRMVDWDKVADAYFAVAKENKGG